MSTLPNPSTKVLRRLKMNNASWEKFKQVADNPFFDHHSYIPVQGVEIEVDNTLPDGVLLPVYEEVPDLTAMIERFRAILENDPARADQKPREFRP